MFAGQGGKLECTVQRQAGKARRCLGCRQGSAPRPPRQTWPSPSEPGPAGAGSRKPFTLPSGSRITAEAIEASNANVRRTRIKLPLSALGRDRDPCTVSPVPGPPGSGSGNHDRRGRRMAGTPQSLREASQPAVPDRGRPHQAEAAASNDPVMSGWRLRDRLRCRHVPSWQEEDRQPTQNVSERLYPALAVQAAHIRAPPGFRFIVNRRLRVPQQSSCRTSPCFLRSRHRRGRQWPRLNLRLVASRCFGPRRH